jgi:hypothetical protein
MAKVERHELKNDIQDVFGVAQSEPQNLIKGIAKWLSPIANVVTMGLQTNYVKRGSWK